MGDLGHPVDRQHCSLLVEQNQQIVDFGIS
jgi:hypothetical protein